MGSITGTKTKELVHDHNVAAIDCLQNGSWKLRLEALYSENVIAKVTRTAIESLRGNNPPNQYPEIVPQRGPNQGRWESREIDFWTCGFFPGCIYSLLETCIKHPDSVWGMVDYSTLCKTLEQLGRQWSDPISHQALRKDTHDLGFVIMPHMRPRWELFHDTAARDVIIQAADSLSGRFDTRVGAIRSWDTFDWHDQVRITSMDDNFLVIIDSMCNMDLLFYAAALTGDDTMAKVAVTHSRTLLQSHLRKESTSREGYSGCLYSTCHLVNFNPASGGIKEVLTAQGYQNNSTWSRGQAWGILGFAEVYQWSGHEEFLDAACGLAEYFLLRLETAPDCVESLQTGKNGRAVGRYVPLWDFDAPIEDTKAPLRDASAGLVAANGMFIISQVLAKKGLSELSSRYLDSSLRIVQDTLDLASPEEEAQFSAWAGGDVAVEDVKPGQRFDSILKHSTVCYNGSSFKKNKASDHGLVYADYYLLEFRARLLRSGIV